MPPPNPLEDQVFQYIKDRRPLKLLFLAITFVGIATSAVTATLPLVQGLRPAVLKLVGTAPPKDVAEKYLCILQSAERSADLLRHLENLAPDATKGAVDEYILSTFASLDRCAQLHGVPQLVAVEDKLGGVATVADLADRAVLWVYRAGNALDAQLLRTDLAAFEFSKYCSRLYTVHRSSDQAPVADQRRSQLQAHLAHHVEAANTQYGRFAAAFDYRTPALALSAAAPAQAQASVHQAIAGLRALFDATP